MAEPAEREATYEDLLRVPPLMVAEIRYGRLHTHPRPAPKHARSSSALGGRLIDPTLRTLEAYELRDGKWLLLATLKEDNPVRLPPFDAITFSLSVLWA